MLPEIEAVLSGRSRWAVVCADNADVLDAAKVIDVVKGVVPQFDHTICDPPFNQRTSEGARRSKNAKKLGDATNPTRTRFIGFDGITSYGWWEACLSQTARWCIAFCALEQLGAYEAASGPDRWIRSGVWVKPNAAPQFTGDRPAQGAEGIAIAHRPGRKKWNRGGDRGVWTYGTEKDAQEIGHPTPKPLPLMLDIVEAFTDPGDLIFDPFCGSGTTGVAALRLGRRFVGVEIDTGFAQIARQQLGAETQGLSLRDARAGQRSLFEVAP